MLYLTISGFRIFDIEGASALANAEAS